MTSARGGVYRKTSEAPTDGRVVPGEIMTLDIDNQLRRAFLKLVAASGAATGFGGITASQAGERPSGYEGIPVAGDFPTGPPVGLRKIAEGLPAPTGYEYVEGGDEDRHFIVTQTGQIYAREPEETDDDAGMGEAETGDPTDEGVTPGTGTADADEFVLEGITSGWVGREPESIADEENPALELTVGEPYSITWENVDGAPHNVEIRDENQQVVDEYETQVISEEGATQTLEFTASEEMAEYVCRIHPNTMVGEIEIMGEDATAEPADGVPTPGDMDLFLDIEDRLVDLGIDRLGGYDERGLLGLAFHPDFEEEGTFYVRYSAPAESAEQVDVPEEFDHVDVLAEFQVETAADEETGETAPGTEGVESEIADAEVDPDTERRILEIPQPQDNHNGGQIAFDDEGYLYTSVGDGGNVHDIGLGHARDWYDENEGGNAQDTQQNLLGGIHRIDVEPRGEPADDDAAITDGAGSIEVDDAGNETETNSTGLNETGANETGGDDASDADDAEDFQTGDFAEIEVPNVDTYSVPDDNPLVGTDHLGEYYAWGFRNPWGMSIDDDGVMFVSDAGQHAVESIYTVDPGGNYSWNVKEGSFCFSPETPTDPPSDCPDQVSGDVPEPRGGEPLENPIAEYRHLRITLGFVDSSVVTGGHRYAGEAFADFQGDFVFANWSAEGIVEPDGEILIARRPDDVEGDEGETDVTDDAEITEDADVTDDTTVNGDADVTNETDGGASDAQPVQPDEQWELEELRIAGAPDQSINRYIYGIERDGDGELYVLANTDFRPFPETGEIYKILPEQEGETVPEPEEPTTVGTGEGAPDEETDTANGTNDVGTGD